MKTNRSARKIVKLQFLVFGLAVVGIAIAGFAMGDALPKKSGKVTPPIAKVELGVLLATAD
jgi:hypothetical protein